MEKKSQRKDKHCLLKEKKTCFLGRCRQQDKCNDRTLLLLLHQMQQSLASDKQCQEIVFLIGGHPQMTSRNFG